MDEKTMAAGGGGFVNVFCKSSAYRLAMPASPWRWRISDIPASGKTVNFDINICKHQRFAVNL
ncbi:MULTISPECIES: hypothetical protein [Comamonas]|jgi:hypothetical protein|uniref:hypothetical protein n=1 Tax=Comamonas TaxID=283 RepID=UPI002840C93E|nr:MULTISPECIES: hypothetical protein [Comamonas]MDR3067109.1 hypothetical protein [Comamonas sp.]MEB5963110.1 hypothetical protein [Comamonas testosteroni]